MIKITFVYGVVTIKKCDTAIYYHATRKCQNSPEFKCSFALCFSGCVSYTWNRPQSRWQVVEKNVEWNPKSQPLQTVWDKTHSLLEGKRQKKKSCKRAKRSAANMKWRETHRYGCAYRTKHTIVGSQRRIKLLFINLYLKCWSQLNVSHCIRCIRVEMCDDTRFNICKRRAITLLNAWRKTGITEKYYKFQQQD